MPRRALTGAASPSWALRARAGRALAPFAGVPTADGALAGLLLDAGDTAVIRRTAEALARVGTAAAVGLLARAVAGADDEDAEWLRTGIHDAFAGGDGAPDPAPDSGPDHPARDSGPDHPARDSGPEPVPSAVPCPARYLAAVRERLTDPEDAVRRGAGELLEWLEDDGG